MIHDIQVLPENLNDKYITLNNNTTELGNFEFVRINRQCKNNPLIVAQKLELLRDDGAKEPCLQIIYRSDRDVFTFSLYAITKLLYYSIMYFRCLPLKKILFWDLLLNENRFLSEINNIEILLLIINKSANVNEYLSKLNLNSDDVERITLIKLAKEYSDNDWELNILRKDLICQIENQLSKIKNAYTNKKYKDIRNLGYAIHNIPEIIRTMVIF